MNGSTTRATGVPPAGCLHRALPTRGGGGGSRLSGRPRTGAGVRCPEPARRQEPRGRGRRNWRRAPIPAARDATRLRPRAGPSRRGADTLRDAHAAWWTDWLEPSYPTPTDEMLARVEEFYDNLRAALDWSTGAPALGLRLLRCLATAWLELGWLGEGALAAERLLTPDNAEQYVRCMARCGQRVWRSGHGQSGRPRVACLEAVRGCRRSNAATTTGWRSPGISPSPTNWRGRRYYGNSPSNVATLTGKALAIEIAAEIAEDDPAAATLRCSPKPSLARASGSRRFQDEAAGPSQCGRTEGDLPVASTLAAGYWQYWQVPSRPQSAIRQLRRPPRPRRGCSPPRGRRRRAPAHSRRLRRLAFNARHRLELLEGRPSSLHPELPAGNHD